MNKNDKEKQYDLLGFDPKEKNDVTNYVSPQQAGINKFKKLQKQDQIKIDQEKKINQIKIDQENKNLSRWHELSQKDKLEEINKGPFSSEEEILKKMNGYYSFKNLESDDKEYLYRPFLNSLRRYLLEGEYFNENKWVWVQRQEVETFRTYYLNNKRSKTLMLELIVNILSSLPLDNVIDYFFQTHIKEKDWHKVYLKKYLKTQKQEVDFYEKFISSCFYDSDLKFSVSNKENKLKIVWSLDQSFIGSDGEFEREDAVFALFDYGNIIEHFGEFEIKTAPKVIRENIFDRHPSCMEDAEEDKKKEYLPIEFWQLQGKNNRQICEAWEQNKIGKKTIKRGKRHISLEWEYPKSFKPFELSIIRSNLETPFREIALYMFEDYDKEIMNMIRYSVGEFG